MSSWFPGLDNVTFRSTPIPTDASRWRKFFLSHRYWQYELKREIFDIYEGFHLPFPRVPNAKTILTLHDLRYLYSPNPLLRRIYIRTLISSLRRADAVVTVSDCTKYELAKYSAKTPIYVIPNGLPDSSFLPPSSQSTIDSFLAKYGLPSRYLLAVGHLEPRKNYLRLIEALSHLRDSGNLHDLLIVGNDSGLRLQLQSEISSRNLDANVTILSGLSESELRLAYEGCSLFVFPSTYEGFGIPILEAMSAGCPMALSDIPVFREITEDCSSYFSPFDPKDIARTISESLSSNQLQDRLVAYGYGRSKSYSYPMISCRYETLYKTLLRTSPSHIDC